MTNEEKEPYQKMATEHREWLRQNGEKYTSQGIPLTMVEAEQKAKQAKGDLIKNTISDMLEKAVVNNGKRFQCLLEGFNLYLHLHYTTLFCFLLSFQFTESYFV